jgi:hypothetical protein
MPEILVRIKDTPPIWRVRLNDEGQFVHGTVNLKVRTPAQLK